MSYKPPDQLAKEAVEAVEAAATALAAYHMKVNRLMTMLNPIMERDWAFASPHPNEDKSGYWIDDETFKEIKAAWEDLT